MDGQRFDEMTRLIGAGATRRRVLKGLTGAFLGVGGLAFGRVASAGTAQCGDENAACDELECCDGLVCFADNTCQTCRATDGSCAGDWECCSGFCDSGTETCQPEEPVCAFIFEDCTELPCCFDALCASDGFGNSICFRPDECPIEGDGCGKGYCCPGLECVENICTVVCREVGEACGAGAPCCEGYECSGGACAPPVVEPECEVDVDCVVVAADNDAAICCAGVCRSIECCIDDEDPNARCGEHETCSEGQCVSVCAEDTDCGGDACCCPDGSCAGSCCPGADPDPKIPAVELPKTGVADGDGGLNGMMAAGLAAGAAALLAGKKLRVTEDA